MKLVEWIIKLLEGNNMNKTNKILYGLDDLDQEQLNQLQEIIDNWTEKALKKRREMRKHVDKLKPVQTLTSNS